VEHPPYSSDLAPSDFCLFGKLKEQMAGSEFKSTEDLLATISALTNAISREELESAFQEWERRWGNASGFVESMFHEKNLVN
jgi:hypothetical protein